MIKLGAEWPRESLNPGNKVVPRRSDCTVPHPIKDLQIDDQLRGGRSTGSAKECQSWLKDGKF